MSHQGHAKMEISTTSRSINNRFLSKNQVDPSGG